MIARTVPALTLRTALKILGHHDRPMLEKIDRLLGGVVLAGGVVALASPAAAPLVGLAAMWGWVNQKNEATGLVRKLLDILPMGDRSVYSRLTTTCVSR